MNGRGPERVGKIGWALALPLIRVALVAAAAVITWLILAGVGVSVPFRRRCFRR